ncbi:predicted protein [Chaetomium globosum CBS 148.51]|uniref:Uncharacterized protein n=1 Tax=Chaetomium globosum (strain ATCC 6205 / CBS 148.51 / DSM 1962 / NBRC 6347 / NRRL 1970) TaxID=306901 RepID=Q2H8Z1_CHAGB|nr:uncharacterized protein CHGG_03313 [Chaetomium globosum CBS 148.51]EAQ91378.1 predicted protein [Chaetomium globosum CBS 148.51]
MAIQVGACRVCAEGTNTFLAKNKSIYAYSSAIGHNGNTTFTINIAGDPRTAKYKSLFSHGLGEVQGIWSSRTTSPKQGAQHHLLL